MNPFGFSNAASMLRSAPLSTPKAASALSGVASKASKLTFSSLLGGAQKGIATINQVIPLYNQVRPLIGNAKTMLNIFKGVSKTPEPEVKVEEFKVETPAPSSNVVFSQNKPNKPFFNT